MLWVQIYTVPSKRQVSQDHLDYVWLMQLHPAIYAAFGELHSQRVPPEGESDKLLRALYLVNPGKATMYQNRLDGTKF